MKSKIDVSGARARGTATDTYLDPEKISDSNKHYPIHNVFK